MTKTELEEEIQKERKIHYEQSFIRQKELRARLGGVSEAWLWRREKAGEFPKRIKLGPRCTAWDLEAIKEWEAKIKSK